MLSSVECVYYLSGLAFGFTKCESTWHREGLQEDIYTGLQFAFSEFVTFGSDKDHTSRISPNISALKTGA